MGMTRCLLARRRWTSRSPLSRSGSCASDATAVERTDCLSRRILTGMQLREIIKRMRHDGCGGRAGKVELLTGVEGVSRPCGSSCW
jgi:hypothetical protein